MPIDPDALAKSVARLEGVDPADTGLDAFLKGAPVLADDLAADPRWPSVGPLAAGHGVRAVLGVPIDLRDGPMAPSTSTPPIRGGGTTARSRTSRPTPG
jgi:GAF domain-containing protein